MARVETLRRERCVACRRDSEPLIGEDLDELLLLVPDWDLIHVDGVPRLTRRFPSRSWAAAMRFAQRVGELAEAEDHHPTILIAWNGVTVSWWTYAIRNLHRNDLIMASQTDALAESV